MCILADIAFESYKGWESPICNRDELNGASPNKLCGVVPAGWSNTSLPGQVPSVIQSKRTSKSILTNKESIHGISCHWNNIEILNSKILSILTLVHVHHQKSSCLHFKVNFCFISASSKSMKLQTVVFFSLRRREELFDLELDFPSKWTEDWLFINQNVLDQSSPLWKCIWLENELHHTLLWWRLETKSCVT